MTRRYYVPDLPRSGGQVQLPDVEAIHALKVMRISVGDQIVLFDGQGNQSDAVIANIGRNECACTAEPVTPVDRELKRSLHLAIALPKADRGREMIQRLTEIGASKITPIVAERTQRPPTESTIEKLRRAVIESCKQCGRNRLMEIGPITSSADFFRAHHPGTCWIAHPYDQAIRIGFADSSTDLVAAIGPEGGFTDNEVKLAIEYGFEAINLGSRNYRVETAAAVIASVASVGEA
jgi:16S rRNA (uracil1498-N3)-methyltransferase